MAPPFLLPYLSLVSVVFVLLTSGCFSHTPASPDVEEKQNKQAENNQNTIWPTIGQIQKNTTQKKETVELNQSVNIKSTHQESFKLDAIDTEKEYTLVTENQKPHINKEIQQRLQHRLDTWVFTHGTPVNYVFNFQGLFSDRDYDAITTHVTFFSEGLHLKNRGALHIAGIPKPSDQTSTFIISAKDNQHGDNQDAWVHAHFELPTPSEAVPKEEKHPLLDSVLYRLETSYFFLDEGFEYETVYCEAFKFIEQQVYYAKSHTKTDCPNDSELQQIGTYHFNGQTLVVNDQWLWEIKHAYQSTKGKGESYLTTVSKGKEAETYTLLKDKKAMESRLNVTTGQTQYQLEKFEYFLPIRTNSSSISQEQYTYIPVVAGVYLYDDREINPNSYHADSDLNINAQSHNMRCEDIIYFYQSSIIGGQGVFSEIISTSLDYRNGNPIECETRLDTNINKTFAFLDLDFDDYHEFVEGEVYSYILKPKPEYAHMVEELKLNLIYHNPTQSH